MTALEGGETIAAGRYLYGRLITIPGMGSKVFPGQASRGAVMPYILYQSFPRPGGGDTDALGGTRVLSRLRYLIKVISASLAEAEPIVRDLDAAIIQGGQQSGYTIGNVYRAEPFELPTLEGDDLYWQTGGYYDLEVSAGVA